MLHGFLSVFLFCQCLRLFTVKPRRPAGGKDSPSGWLTAVKAGPGQLRGGRWAVRTTSYIQLKLSYCNSQGQSDGTVYSSVQFGTWTLDGRLKGSRWGGGGAAASEGQWGLGEARVRQSHLTPCLLLHLQQPLLSSHITTQESNELITASLLQSQPTPSTVKG